MSADFSRDRIRIAIPVELKSEKLGDVFSSPRCWRGTDLQIEFVLTHDGELVDVSEYGSITFDVRPFNTRTGNLLMSKTIAVFNNALVLADWQAGTAQHGVLQFSSGETNLDLNGENSRDFWFVFSAITNTDPARRVTLGGGKLTIIEDGSLSDEAAVPPLGSSIIPLGSVYSALGQLALAVTAGRTYLWTKAGSDTSVTNGTETILASGTFIAQGASVVLNGTANALVTATVRYPVFLTVEQADARYLKNTLKTINPPGVMAEFRSDNDLFGVVFGVSNAGEVIVQVKPVS